MVDPLSLEMSKILTHLVANKVSVFRWTKLRFAMIPLTVFLEPFSECMLSGALAALASYLLFRFVGGRGNVMQRS